MNSEPFLQPRLTGPRFEGHAIPLEFLKDLSVLEEMFVEVAKAEYLKEHPDRKRAPRGFAEGVELKLTDIEDGSAKPIITLFFLCTTLFPPESKAFFERARESFVSAIAAAEQNQIITTHLPERSLGYFDRIGRSLRDGEAMEFTVPEGNSTAKLTKETRRKLVLASAMVNEVTEETQTRGTIPEADQEKMTFYVQLADGRRIHSPMGAQHLDAILEAFNGYKAGVRVLLQGIGRFDRKEQLKEFESIQHVSVLDVLDIQSRLDELRSLSDGWLDGTGLAPSSVGLDWLTKVFAIKYPDDLPSPYLYPTESGGIQAEWSLGVNEVSLTVELESHLAHWHALDSQNDSEESREMSLDQDDEWHWLIGKIRSLTGGEA